MTVTEPRPTAPQPGTPANARQTTVYFDEQGRRQVSARPVKVNDLGQIVAREWKCPRCVTTRWMALSAKVAPVCQVDEVQMRQVPLTRPPLLPWREIWSAVEAPLRPVWAFGAAAAAGSVVADAGVPGWALGVAAPLVAEGSRRVVPLVAKSATVKQARLVAGAAGAAALWLGWAAATGLDADTTAGVLAEWAPLPVLWLPFAATWWRLLRQRRNQPPAPVQVVEVRDQSPDERDAADAARIWRDEVNVLGTELAVGTWKRLPEVHGWQAVVVAAKRGALNSLGGEFNQATVKRVAAAYDVPFAAVTWIEAYEDSPNKALLLIQPHNPLGGDGQMWAGPDSIDLRRGVAESGRLIDGSTMYETLYRYGWGAPSEIAIGTTGGGKSQRLRKKMVIERWSSFVDGHGVRRGAFVTFLHDPKRLESYAEFRDAVHCYGITRDDAHLIIDALLREMFRRYDFLAGLEWVDGKGRRRRGGQPWNPLVHGPIISHYWDEFHELAGDAEFVKKLEKLARYQRACAMRGTLATHMATLGDTGSQALRDMLAGGRATLFRTTSGLNASLVTGGQLTADPRTLPRDPGMCYVSDGATATIMGRESYIPSDEDADRLAARSLYDWLFNDVNEPIGYPAEIPAETLEAFGLEFVQWMEAGRSPGGRRDLPKPSAAQVAVSTSAKSDARCVDATLSALACSQVPLGMNDLKVMPGLSAGGWSTRTIRDALQQLGDTGLVFKSGSGAGTRYELTPQARANFEAQMLQKLEAASEGAE